MKPRTKNFRIATFHGKLEPENHNSESRLRNELYLVNQLKIKHSNRSETNVRLLAYEMPLFEGQSRNKCVDLFGYDEDFYPYIIELKVENSSERLEKVIDQVNQYEDDIITNSTLDKIENEVREKFYLPQFKFNKEKIVKVILIPRNYFNKYGKECKALKSEYPELLICSLSKIASAENLIKSANKEGYITLSVKNK